MERNSNRRRPRCYSQVSAAYPSGAEVVCFTSDYRANDVAYQPPDGGGIHVLAV
ncbi:UNVERIFIED_CONTAM: hypothetical protein Sradi_4372500 [Sesamum radiatum]|uniref:Uncharacterized protein n=1 Tax=Sesamum radiatum TaxID=300843 RepID=A0AAW2NPK8_SESRA